MKSGWLKPVTWGLSVLMAVSCNKDPVNQPPVPFFTIIPDTGDTETLFVLDASGSHDPEDPDSVLEYRWDYENDGIYDYPFVRTLTNTHKFPVAGLTTVKLQVRDLSGGLATTTREMNVAQGNANPMIPFGPNPRDSSNNLLTVGRLSWVALDPYDDPLTFDLYLGLDNDPPLLVENLPTDEFFTSELIPGQRYYWKVVARDPGGLTAVSPVWRFSIHSGIYQRDTMTDPRDGQTYPIIKLNGIWWMARNLNFDRPYSSYCYDDDPLNCEKYGRLYWVPINDSVTCPPGWRLPQHEDWSSLERSLGLVRESGQDYGWMGNDQAYQMMEGGTSGLNLQFSGYADWDGNFFFINEKAYYTQGYLLRMMIRNYGKIYVNTGSSSIFGTVYYTAVRCIRKD
ncbi:MAG: FISUMP domain-containing protein [Bacteroidota bacterium]